MPSDKEILLKGASMLGLTLSLDQADRLLNYLNLLSKWNKLHNITSINNHSEAIKKHLLDSLSIINFIKPGRILDVGSGAGLPAIVIAILREDVNVVSIDSVGKKCRFMENAKYNLDIKNFGVINQRVEVYETEECFDQIVTRAFASVSKTISLTSHLICRSGEYLFMKGKAGEESIPPDSKLNEVAIPFSNFERCIIQVNAN